MSCLNAAKMSRPEARSESLARARRAPAAPCRARRRIDVINGESQERLIEAQLPGANHVPEQRIQQALADRSDVDRFRHVAPLRDDRAAVNDDNRRRTEFVRSLTCLFKPCF
jgi:hypothetical protein